LGHGDTKPQPKPKLIEALGKLDGKVAGIAIGYNHSVARMDNGQLWVWGAGRNGELAQPTTNRALLPKLVPLSEKVPFKTIGVGYQYTIAVSSAYPMQPIVPRFG
jgi:alpha-tubulin suppressor-like RCC1 family protein